MKKYWPAIFFLATSAFASSEECAKLLQTNLQRQTVEIEQLEVAYQNKLGMFSNPFDFVWSSEEGEQLFARLMLQKEGDEWKDGPLKTINTELKISSEKSVSYSDEMVQNVITDVRDSLEEPGIERMDLQGNLLALKYTKEYLRRFQTKGEVLDRDGEKIETERQKDSRPQEDSKKKEEVDRPPDYPELPESYQPHTKALPEGGGQQKPFRVAEVDFKADFFVNRIYNELSRHTPEPFRGGALPIPPKQPGAFKETQKHMKIRTFGKREVSLHFPSGHRPLQPADARASLVSNDSGGYVLKLEENLPEIDIPLVESDNIKMMSPLLEYYIRPLGFSIKEWPDKVQAEIFRKFSVAEGKEKPLETAKAIADHIKKEYLYSVGDRPETDPIDALNGGAFQCDMAAYIMVSILRDVYQIPSRAVSGFQAEKYRSGQDKKSYLVLPSTAHAWVEVFYNGKWHTFDPTPVKKDGKGPENKNKSEYSPWEATRESGEQTGEKQENTREGEMGEVEERENDRSLLQRNTEEGLKNNLPEKNATALQKEAMEDEGLSLKNMADLLELGSLELEPKHYNPLTARAMRIFLGSALDPHHKSEDVLNLLNGMLRASGKFHDPQFQQLYRESIDIHSYDHPGMIDWVERLMALAPKQDLNQTHQELFRLKSSLSLYGRVLDSSGPIPHPGKLLRLLESLHRMVDEQAHPDAQDIGIVQHLVKGLPNVAQELLSRRYGFSMVGPNAPTKKIAKDMKAGKLNDLRLMAILNPLTDFILNASPRPESVEVKQWMRNTRRSQGRDLLPLVRPSDISKALVNRPHRSLEKIINSGTAFVPVRRQTTRIPLGYGKDEAERVTIVLYDTSGSMNGDPGEFQAGLISSFTAKALSDLTPSGRHRHRVVIVPFDSVPGTPVPVTNTAQALDVIDNYHSKLANTAGGTNIQAALMQGLSLIADAEKRSGEPLAAANILLMTDGIDDGIDARELYRARNAIDRQTPLQTMFVAIGETNPTLMEFAMDSRRVGMEKGFYREFRRDHIEDILQESRNLNFGGQDYFYSDVSAEDLPKEFYDIMESVLKEATLFFRQIRDGSHYIRAEENLDRLRKLKWHNVPDRDRPLESWLIELRALARTPIFQSRKILEVMVDDLVKNFYKISGFKMETLGDYEQEQLRHLVRYAAGLEEKK